MPNATLTDALKEAYASAPTDKYVIHTLEFRQTGVQDPVRVARSHYDVVATDEDSNEVTFSAGQFVIELPSTTDEGVLSVSFSVSNIDNVVGNFVQTADASTSVVEIIYRPFLSDDLSGGPVWNPPLTLFLRSAQINSISIRGVASFADIVNAKFPRHYYNRKNFPGLT